VDSSRGETRSGKVLAKSGECEGTGEGWRWRVVGGAGRGANERTEQEG
jgi:hypothetical protein